MVYNKKENTLCDKNIYIDKKNRLVYYRPKSQKGYVITPGSEGSFYNFYNRFIYGMLAAIFFYLVVNNVWIGIVVGIMAFAYMEYKYHALINTYPMIQNFDITGCTPTTEARKAESAGKTILKSILYIAVAILLIVNLYMMEQEVDLVSKIVSYIAAAGALFLAVKNAMYLKK